MHIAVVWLLLLVALRVEGSLVLAVAESGAYVGYTTSPGSHIRTFVYKPGVVALVSQQPDKGIVVQTQRIQSFEQTAPIVVKETAHPHNYRVDGCFERSGKAYLIAYDAVLNETVIVKGQEELFLPLHDYDLLRYDPFEDTVHLVRNRTLLKYRFESILRYNDVGEPQSPPLKKEHIEDVFTDLMVVDGKRYAIFNQAVNRQDTNGSWVRMMPTKAEHFWFQLFPSTPHVESPSMLTQVSPTSVVFIVEILTLLFAVYCLNMRLKLRPQTGIYELSRATPPTERA